MAAVRLFSPTAIFVHSILFTPLMGGVLAAMNGWRSSERRTALRDLAAAGGVTAVLFTVAGLWPDSWSAAGLKGIVLGGTYAAASYLKRQQTPGFERHQSMGGLKARWWPATLIGVAVAASFIAVLILGADVPEQ